MSATISTGLGHRIAALTQRERVFLLLGAAGVTAFLLYLLLPGGEAEAIELAEPSPVSAPAAAAPAPVALPPPAPAPVEANVTAGLVLRGVMGGGPAGGAAIIAFPDGAQRVVRIGREFLPGLTLREVGLNYAIASAAGGDIRLELNRSGGQTAAPAAIAAPALATTPAPSRQRETLAYRMGLAPRKSGGRISGFAIRPGADLPLLQRAGLRPGDVLVAVNGQAVASEEKVLELPQEIAGSYQAEFEFERGGQRMKTVLEVNKRPSS